MLGEAARTFPDAERYYEAYDQAIRAVGAVAGRGHSISVKLSALHPRYEVGQYDRCVPSLIGQVEALALLAKEAGIGFNAANTDCRQTRADPRRCPHDSCEPEK